MKLASLFVVLVVLVGVVHVSGKQVVPSPASNVDVIDSSNIQSIFDATNAKTVPVATKAPVPSELVDPVPTEQNWEEAEIESPEDTPSEVESDPLALAYSEEASITPDNAGAHSEEASITSSNEDVPQPLEASITEAEPTVVDVAAPVVDSSKPEVLEASIQSEPLSAPAVPVPDVPQPLDASIGNVADIPAIPNGPDATTPDVPSPEEASIGASDFGGQAQPTFQPPTPEELEVVRSQLTSTLRGFLSSFFGSNGELNDSPNEQGEVETETRELPGGGLMIIQRRSSPTSMEHSFFESSSTEAGENGYSAPMVQDPFSFDLPPPPPMAGGFLSRFFGQGPPPPAFAPDEGMFGGEHPHRHHGGCKKHRSGLIQRLKSLFNNDDFPSPPPFMQDMHHDEPAAWGDMSAGPFVRARFNLDFDDSEQQQSEFEQPEDSAEQEEQDPSSEQEDDSNFVEAEDVTTAESDDSSVQAPSSSEQSDASELGFVAPHTYERDWRMDAMDHAEGQDPSQPPTDRSDNPTDTDENMPPPPRHHRGWFKKHKKLVFGLIGAFALLLAVAIFVVLVKRARRRRLAAAQAKTFVASAPPLDMTTDVAQPVQAYAVQLSPINQHGYRLLSEA